jgi:anti-anti-sigma factor
MSDDRPLFTVQSDSNGGLRLQGELDSATVARLLEAFADKDGVRDITVDVSDLTFIDSTGLHAIVELAQSREPDGTVTVTGVTPYLAKLFEIVHVDELPNLRVHGRA